MIRANKPTQFRTIITAVQIVQPGFHIVLVMAIQEGVINANIIPAAAVQRQAFAPRVVLIEHTLAMAAVNDANYVALQIVLLHKACAVVADDTRSKSLMKLVFGIQSNFPAPNTKRRSLRRSSAYLKISISFYLLLEMIFSGINVKKTCHLKSNVCIKRMNGFVPQSFLPV